MKDTTPPKPSESPTPKTGAERIALWLEDAANDGFTSASPGDQHSFRVAATLIRSLSGELAASLVEQERLRAGWVESDKIALAGRIADAASSAIAPFELKRLREVEHMAWHVLEDSEENATTGGISIQPNDDYFALCALLPDEHPGDGVPVDGGSAK